MGLGSLAFATAAGVGADRASPIRQTPKMPENLPQQTIPAIDTRDQEHVWMEVTAYCPCQICCGPNAQGLTASGKPVTHNAGRFVAADTTRLAFGSLLRIPGYHNATPVPVLDRGGAIKGNKLDVYFPTHEQAKQWGRQWLLVSIVSE